MSSAVSEVGHVSLRPLNERQLAVQLSDDVAALSERHKLLVAFQFGAAESADNHPAVVSTALDPVSRDSMYECWWYKGEVDYTVIGNARVAQCADYAVTILQLPDAGAEDFKACTRDAYRELLQVIGNSEHRHLIKIWNYFTDINEGDGDREKYRQFSIGRAIAFEEFGVLERAIPTGTAIGSVRSGDFSIIAMTSKHELQSVENPRQVSAFHYPRQYGPESPRFSRGGLVATEDDKLLVLSGTAAIVGHESVHGFDVRLQISETLENLGQVCKAASALQGEGRQLVLDRDSVLRVYLRDPNDRDFVAQHLTELLGNIESNVVFLHANICRRELMVEIDGVRVL